MQQYHSKYCIDVGNLQLDIISATNLEAVDGSSDPYCVITLNQHKVHKTKAAKKTLNPTYNETCLIPIQSRSRAKIGVEIRDKNKFSSDVVLGSLSNISLKSLHVNEPFAKDFRLENARSGKIRLQMTFLTDDNSSLVQKPVSKRTSGLRGLSVALRKSTNLSETIDSPRGSVSNLSTDRPRSVSEGTGLVDNHKRNDTEKSIISLDVDSDISQDDLCGICLL